MPQPPQQIAFQEYIHAINDATDRLERLARAVEDALPGWKWEPVVRALERAFDLLESAGEGAPFVPEQHALDQRFRQRRAVDRNERSVASVALGMDRPGDQLLAGAALPLDQHRGARGGDRVERLERSFEGCALPDDLALAPQLRHLVAQGGVFAPQPREFEGLVHDQLELLRPHGLGHVVHGARLHGRDRVLDAGVTRRHHQGDVVAVAGE